MSNEDIQIIQVSDLHLAEKLTFQLKGVNTYQSASQVLKAINAPNADAVVVTGDISEDGSLESYQHFKTLCRQHNVYMPYCLPGNHDSLENMTRQLKGMPYCGSLCLKSWLFIFVNTHREGYDEGRILTEEYHRITSLLARHPEQHVALFMHHHALPTGSAWIDHYQLDDNDRFINWLRSHSSVRTVINGHIHQTFSAKQGGVTFYGSPSTCIQYTQGLNKAKIADLGPGYRELVFRANGEIDTQVIHLSPTVCSDSKPLSIIN